MRRARGWRCAFFEAVLACGLGCESSLRRLDEYVFHTGPGYELKVVRYHENLPLHYTGEIYSVQCRSAATHGLEARPAQHADWRVMERGGAIGSAEARDLAARLDGRYIAIDASRLVWIDRRLRVSFDACGDFAAWDPVDLPAERVDPVEKPAFCAPKGSANCGAMDFEGERAPRYENIRIESDGQIQWPARRRSATSPDSAS